MISRRTAFVSLVYEEDHDPQVGGPYRLNRAAVGGTGDMSGFVLSTETDISSSGIVTWQKSNDDGASFTDVSISNHKSLVWGGQSLYTGSLNIVRVTLKISSVSLDDYGIYRYKVTGSDGTRFSPTFDFTNPS
jgi:hypothetical protein